MLLPSSDSDMRASPLADNGGATLALYCLGLEVTMSSLVMVHWTWCVYNPYSHCSVD